MENTEISAMYSLTTSMCYELKDYIDNLNNPKRIPNEWHVMFDNFLKFMMDNFTTELCIMGARTAIKIYELPVDNTKLKNLTEFYTRYGSYIRSALSGD